MDILDSQINKNFLIRVEVKGQNKTFLHSATSYKMLIDNDKLTQRHFNKAFNSPLDICTIKLRRGLKIDFVSK